MDLEKLRKKLPSSGPVTLCVNTSEGYNETVEQHGHLILPYIASMMANTSQQRIYSLIDQGKFTKIVVFGVVHIPHREFQRWQESPRTAGRPRTAKPKDDAKVNFEPESKKAV